MASRSPPFFRCCFGFVVFADRYFLLCYLLGAKRFGLANAASVAGYGLWGWCWALAAAQLSALAAQQWGAAGAPAYGS
jgi:hypothetical protein